ncbi:MAG: aldolase/citrate lyase family protein [Longimicrobiales bacterium]
MRAWLILTTMAGMALVSPALAQSQNQSRLNPVIELLEQKKPVFGLYAPSNRRPGGRDANAANATPAKTPAQLAQDAVAYKASDFIFDGTMEGNFERAYHAFAELVKGLSEAGVLRKAPTLRLTHPLMVKMHEIAPDPALAAQHISQQLNLGVSGIVFVGVESAAEVKAGLAAMRFKSNGGTRPDDVGGAAAFWGMSAQEYREKADLWPLNPTGELVNWTIVESKEGLARVREIAAVKGVGVLFPGAGTLRGLFSSTDANGQRVLDEKAWEAAIQQVLAACKEFNVPCGYPATANDIEMRMKQGFSVFIMNWGEGGFRAIDVGRQAAGR